MTRDELLTLVTEYAAAAAQAETYRVEASHQGSAYADNARINREHALQHAAHLYATICNALPPQVTP